MFKVFIINFEQISHVWTRASVSITDFEQVNASWVLRASFTDITKDFFHLLKSDENSKAVTHLRREILWKYLTA